MKYEPEEMMGGRGEANCAIVHQHDVMAGSECLHNLDWPYCKFGNKIRRI